MSDNNENRTDAERPLSVRRPNANYKLSKENVPQEDIVYHYDREARLAKAPRSVQALYEDQPVQRFGLFRSFRKNKPLGMTFFSIIMCCVLFVIAAYSNSSSKNNILDGNQLFIAAAQFGSSPNDDVTIVTLIKRQSKSFLSRAPAYTGPVDITARQTDGADAARQFAGYNHRIIFTRERQEQFSFVLPFNADEIELFFAAGKKNLAVTIKPAGKSE